LTVHGAIRESDPCAVIGVGIAFGGYTDDLKMNDVLVSDLVIPYEMRRAGARDEYRGPKPEAGPTLLSRFSNATGWTYARPDGRACNVKIGPLLSGESLLDNLDEKVELFASHPTAIGGEMEAAGIYAAASHEGAKKESIVVKAVCDWADGTKKARGDAYQPVAADAAMSLVTFVLSMPDVLGNLTNAARLRSL
jgi:nucleoside phosphorylase